MSEFSYAYLRTQQELSSTPIASYVPYSKQYLPENSASSPTEPFRNATSSVSSSAGTDYSSLESFRSRSLSAPADYLPEAFQVSEFYNFSTVESPNSNPSIAKSHQDTLPNHHHAHHTHYHQHHHQTHNHTLHHNHHHAPLHTFTPIVFPTQRIFECQREVESSPPKNNYIVLCKNSSSHRVKSILKKKFSIAKNLHPVQESSHLSPEKTEDRTSSPSKLSHKNILKDSIYLQQNLPQHTISVPKLTVPQQLSPQPNSPLHKTKLVTQRSSSLHGSKRVHFSPKNQTFSFEDSVTTTDDSDSESLDQSSNEDTFFVGNTPKLLVPSTDLNQQNSFYLQTNQIKSTPDFDVKSPSNQPQTQSVQSQQNQTECTSKPVSPLLALFKDQQISKRAKIYYQPQENGNQQSLHAPIKRN